MAKKLSVHDWREQADWMSFGLWVVNLAISQIRGPNTIKFATAPKPKITIMTAIEAIKASKMESSPR